MHVATNAPLRGVVSKAQATRSNRLQSTTAEACAKRSGRVMPIKEARSTGSTTSGYSEASSDSGGNDASASDASDFVSAKKDESKGSVKKDLNCKPKDTTETGPGAGRSCSSSSSSSSETQEERGRLLRLLGRQKLVIPTTSSCRSHVARAESMNLLHRVGARLGSIAFGGELRSKRTQAANQSTYS